MTKKEKELIERIKNDDPTAWDDFANEYETLIYTVIKKHNLYDLVQDDEESVFTEALNDSILAFKRKVLFPAALVRKITSNIVVRYAKVKLKDKDKRVGLDEAGIEKIPDKSERLDDVIIHQEEESIKVKVLKICIAELEGVQKETMKLFLKFPKWADVARKRSVARSAITDMNRRIFPKLQECMNRELQRVFGPAYSYNN